MSLGYGEGGNFTVKMDGPFGNYGSGGALKMVSISAPAANWKGGESPYSQVVAVDAVTVSSKVDVQLSLEQVIQFADRIFAFQAINNNGVITLYAYGSMPDVDCEIQATISEVMGEGLILGNVFTVTNAQADYAQTDSSKADFIKNKPDAAIQKAQQTADSGKQTAEAAMPKAGGNFSGPVTVQEPTANNNPATKVYVDEKHKVFTVNLTAAGWTGDGPYTQTVAVEGILATDKPHYGCIYDADQDTRVAQKEAFACVDDLDTTAGSVTFTCFEDKPEVNIPIQMEVNR